MSWSLSIGKVAGTVVRIHLTFLLFLAWIFAASYASGGSATAWDSLLFMVLLFLCVLLHEFGHIFTARAFGVQTPYVTLLPIGGVAQLERIPEEPGQEFLIAIAGPLVNVAITLLLIVAFGADLQMSAATSVDNTAIPLVNRLAAVNLFLALFNLIPAFPMDGGRVLRALLASRFGYVRATGIAASIGQFVAFVLGFIGLLANPILIFIAIFVYLAAASEAHMVSLRAVSRGVPVSHAMMTQFATLSPEAHIDEAVQTLLQTSQGEFPVVDGAGKPVGVLDRAALVRALKTLGPDARVGDAMTPDVPVIGYRSTLEQAFKLLQEKSAPAVAVTDSAGRLTGLITSETIAEMMMLQEAMPDGVKLGPWSKPQGV
ncbi:site-2 protease family protein [Pseudolabrys taiwanensis]|uniref:Zinc metalloprotease n=1 Tax=Pseudolabrys taiwanensis TaxID=331696 RepID=A0A346A027_9HYPH|nr:site-2 protease family protein [Pseudolabrys taiwanensis]AXK82524.1 site-2 protease family protein [Pseudolabrys taiwanensis]